MDNEQMIAALAEFDTRPWENGRPAKWNRLELLPWRPDADFSDLIPLWGKLYAAGEKLKNPDGSLFPFAIACIEIIYPFQQAINREDCDTAFKQAYQLLLWLKQMQHAVH